MPDQAPSDQAAPDQAPSEHAPSGRVAILRARARVAADRAMTLPGAALSMRIVRDVVTAGLSDRAMTLAAQAFTSVLPIVILLTTIPVGRRFLDKAFDGFGVDPSRVSIPAAQTDATLGAFGVIGALMVIAGATSLSRALGRMFTDTWHVNRLPATGWWRWVVVIFVLPIAVIMQGLIVPLHRISLSGVRLNGFGIAGVILEFVGTFAVWWITWIVIPRLLVSRQVPMRLLAVNAALTSLLITVLMVGSRVVLPAIMSDTLAHYGTLGLVFVAISWLFLYAAVLVVSATLVHTVVVDDGALGRRLARITGVPAAEPRQRISIGA
ncbi:YhjD/YihY/BrkB family envelope integrity protein [Gordonia sp. NB41Y]|uniref:YhjD/YihY/BrkB family envelope integrity protein n=1 Tax=Gordonia sp. NB41Y TaxID=875808 RepID=UPI0009E76929|nr:YhjD/YihY/BrkB family envelope integrity protein [Gordonia sp. NB41Y]WLP92066.1 YhjD/YihY/BrkB family envelope integrity protein [Gordonia sp. NB41Y]